MAPPKKSALRHLRWLLLGLIPAAFCVLSHYGLLRFQEDKFLDWRFGFRGSIDAPIRIVYVDVDSQSISEIGGFPWSRMYFARVAKALIESGKARVVGMDFVFSEDGMSESIDMAKRIEGNAAFARYLFRGPPVVLAAAYAGLDKFRAIDGKIRLTGLSLIREDRRPISEIEPPEVPELRVPNRASKGTFLYTPPFVGLIDTYNGETRYVPAFAPSRTKTFNHMAIELARLYWGLGPDAVRIEADQVRFLNPDGSTKAAVPLIDHQLIEINWFAPWTTKKGPDGKPLNPRLVAKDPHISFSTVYNYADSLGSADPEARKSAEAFFAQDAFKGAVVLIGPTDRLLQDLSTTPMDDAPVPKVSVHGNLLKTIVSGRFLSRVPERAEWLLVLLLSLAVAWLSVAGGARAVAAKVTAGLLVVGYALLAFHLFRVGHLVLPLVAPLGAAFSTTFAAVAWQVIEEQKQKGRIKGMFGTYVSPALVERMVSAGEEPKLGGIEENITAYFSDIQSFSNFSEKLTPSLQVELMNEYLTACTDIVQEEGGTLDKYVGDMVVVIFGAPLPLADHPLRGCVAALRVHKRVAELREKWRREGDKWPEIVRNLQTRIGLNTGPAVVGNMGSHTRFNYTMMGDNVNIASRMESGAKSWGVYSMCTENTRTACERIEPGRIVFRNLGRIVVKGRAQPLPIHEMVCLAEDATDRVRSCIALFEEGLARYYARDWDGAVALFRRSEALEAHGEGRVGGTETNPSLVYIRIAESYKAEPPDAQWNGVYVMKDK